MKGKLNNRTVLALILAGLCVFLIVRLVLVSIGYWGATSPGTSARADSGPAPAVSGRLDLYRYDPQVHWDTLKQINDRPLPDLKRNPFEFEPTPQEIQAKNAALHPVPAGPPPPPPIPIKALGYQQDGKGALKAYLSDDQETYVVHEGEEFGQRFKVLKITSSTVEVEDETYHQTAQLPYPQP
jgi:hypothetical protein